MISRGSWWWWVWAKVNDAIVAVLRSSCCKWGRCGAFHSVSSKTIRWYSPFGDVGLLPPWGQRLSLRCFGCAQGDCIPFSFSFAFFSLSFPYYCHKPLVLCSAMDIMAIPCCRGLWQALSESLKGLVKQRAGKFFMGKSAVKIKWLFTPFWLTARITPV